MLLYKNIKLEIFFKNIFQTIIPIMTRFASLTVQNLDDFNTNTTPKNLSILKMQSKHDEQ
jgi:hypothetical protein